MELRLPLEVFPGRQATCRAVFGTWGSFPDDARASHCPFVLTSFTGHPRNLDDKQILAINENDGMIGVTYARQFLNQDINKACIDDVYRHIDYILNLMGNDDHVGFGSDFDGTTLPYDMQGVQSYKEIIEYLQSKNYSDSTIEKLSHKNALNLLQKVL